MKTSNNLFRKEIVYKELKPTGQLNDYVDSFWMLHNSTTERKEIVIVPDGRIDLSFSFENPNVVLLGIDRQPSPTTLMPDSRMYTVSFKLLAIEYLFNQKFPSLLDSVYPFSVDHFGITLSEFEDFEQFSALFSATLIAKITRKVDVRKKKLFDLIYNSSGAISINELSDRAGWSSRQINRYFNHWFGMPLKVYCTILRFRASFQSITEGRLYPDLSFSDQAHFIRDVKKFSGVTPKELSRNKNDRFIQFSVLKNE